MMPAGRKPKPTQLKVVQGTYRKDRANPHEPVAAGDLFEPPTHFNEDQRAVWTYAIENAPRGVLRKIDLSVLEVWVTAYVYHREASSRVASTGQVITTKTGYPITNPFMANMNKQAQIMVKAASEMGFTPASRSRIVVAEGMIHDDPWARLAADGT
jgi:P27 family predicted phage terminase small subunit